MKKLFVIFLSLLSLPVLTAQAGKKLGRGLGFMGEVSVADDQNSHLPTSQEGITISEDDTLPENLRRAVRESLDVRLVELSRGEISHNDRHLRALLGRLRYDTPDVRSYYLGAFRRILRNHKNLQRVYGFKGVVKNPQQQQYVRFRTVLLYLWQNCVRREGFAGELAELHHELQGLEQPSREGKEGLSAILDFAQQAVSRHLPDLWGSAEVQAPFVSLFGDIGETQLYSLFRLAYYVGRPDLPRFGGVVPEFLDVLGREGLQQSLASITNLPLGKAADKLTAEEKQKIESFANELLAFFYSSPVLKETVHTIGYLTQLREVGY